MKYARFRLPEYHGPNHGYIDTIIDIPVEKAALNTPCILVEY